MTIPDPIALSLRDLRHLYEQMIAGHVTDTASAARGLLGPAIERIERSQRPRRGDFMAAIRDLRGSLRAAGVTISAAEWEAEQAQERAEGETSDP